MTKITKAELAQKKSEWIDLLVTETPTTTTKKLVEFVKYPVITEKTYIALFKNNQYTFDVDIRLTKTQIKKLFEMLFNVTVLSVNTHIPPRKKLRVGIAQGFRPRYKRAIITVNKDQSITYKAETKGQTN